MIMTNLNSGRDSRSCGQIVSREEYNALISQLAQEVDLEQVAPLPEADARVRRLEFNMMVLVGLILAVFILCQTS